MAAGLRLLHLLPGLELCLRSRALTLLSSRYISTLTPRRIPDEQLGHCKDANGKALDLEARAHLKELCQLGLQFSFEEESDDVVCEISEGVVRDVEKAAIELLAAK